MRKKKSVSQRAREMIEQGHNNKYIVAQLKCKPQVVYNVRYQINKSKGLGALGQQGTGISAPPVWSPPAILPMPKLGEYQITMVEPTPPTLWQRIKGWFRGTNA
jgi:hypothetical protein